MTSFQKILHDIRRAESAAKRNSNSIRLIAVSKKQSIDKIRELYLQGQKAFGENYLQEALEKQALLKDCDIEWHFIGHIQSNKTKEIAENFSWVQSVDRFKIAKRLNDQRPKHLPPLNICIEVNIDREENKSGVFPEDLFALAKAIVTLKNLRLRGLMVIPEKNKPMPMDPRVKPEDDEVMLSSSANPLASPSANPIASPSADPLASSSAKAEDPHKPTAFEKTAEHQQQLIEMGFALDTLSMGMSADFDAAIHAGSTMVRIGTALFGMRVEPIQYSKQKLDENKLPT